MVINEIRLHSNAMTKMSNAERFSHTFFGNAGTAVRTKIEYAATAVRKIGGYFKNASEYRLDLGF